MLEVKKQDLIQSVIQTIVDIISRRTSESYAAMVMNTIFKKYDSDYVFVKDIEIINPQVIEVFEMVNIKSDFEYVKEEDIGKFVVDVINDLITTMGKNAGY